MCNDMIDKIFANKVGEKTDNQLGHMIGDALIAIAFQKETFDKWIDNSSADGFTFDTHAFIWNLARTSLVTKTFMPDEESTSRLRRIGVVTVLKWLVNGLQNDHKAVLASKYFMGSANRAIAKELHFTPQHVGGNLRLRALEAAARQFKEEARNPKGEEERKRLAIEWRYSDFEWESTDDQKYKSLVAALTQIKEILKTWAHKEQRLELIERIDDIKKNHLRFTFKPEGKHLQKLLRLCAIISPQPMPTYVLIKLANRLGIENSSIYFSHLKEWIVQEDTEYLTKMRDSVAGEVLRSYITPEEYRQYAIILLERGDFVQAAKYFVVHNFFDDAADILIKHYNQIIETGKVRDVYEFFVQGSFAADISSDRQSLFHIAMGRAAQIAYGDHYDKAKTQFDKARLVALDNYTRAWVCYYLGKLLENSSDFTRTLNEFEQGIALLTNQNTLDAQVLLIYLYVAQYWIYLLQKQDKLGAEEIQKKLLMQAKEIKIDKKSFFLERPEFQLRFDVRNNLVEAYNFIENALGGNSPNVEEEIEHYTNALNAANNTGKPILITRALFNLGQAKIHSGQKNLIEEGIKDVNEAKTHAENFKLKEYEGKCIQKLGAACFYKDDYQEAIDKYLKAAKIFEEMNTNDHWLSSIYADLCEAYYHQVDFVNARKYFQEAAKLNATFGFSNVKDILEKHMNLHPILAVNFDDIREAIVARILRIWGKTIERGYTSRTDYIEAAKLLGIDMNNGKFNADRNQLLKLGLLTQKGKGPATLYYPVSLPPTQKD